MAAMCGLQDYKKKVYIFVVFKQIIPITMAFMHIFWALRPIWLAFFISSSSFLLVDTYFWIYFSWLDKSGCQNLKLAGNSFPQFLSFWIPASHLQQFSAMFSHSHSFPAIYCPFQPFPAIDRYFKPFQPCSAIPAVSSNFQPFQDIFSNWSNFIPFHVHVHVQLLPGNSSHF